MEPLYLDFSDSAYLSGRLRFLGILMSVLGLISTAICILGKTYGISFFISLFWLLYGIAMLTPYPYRISVKNKPFFKVDENSIEYRTTPFSLPKKEEWGNITSLTIKLRALYIDTKDNRKRKISLNWVSFRNALIIKQTMRDYATSKGVEVFLINV